MRRIGFIVVAFLLVGCLQTRLDTLPRDEVYFGKERLTVEIAADRSSQSKGLMFRKNLPKDEGMIFDFGKPGVYKFWMKNTVIPLSIAFLSPEGEVLKIADMNPNNPERRYESPVNTRFAIEANQGWFTERGISVGDQSELPRALAKG